ncbi:UDP-N-acetyl-D-mannosamine dehydrogenase [Corynebacterium aurimucosum]
MSKAEVCFVGLGYIGLPTAVVMANSGLQVIGLDVNAENVERINRGEVTIVENGLEEALKTAIRSGNFRATTEPPEASTFILAVPTPFNADRTCDMSYIYSAAESIAPKLYGDELIVLESTSPPGTTEKLAQRIFEIRPELSGPNSTSSGLRFAHCPERILPGKAMEELVTNDRIIGGMDEEATQRACEVYASFCEGELLRTNARTAEMAKLTENSFRDVNIAFANELSLISDELDIDVWELIELANHHPRVNILEPGPGVGGHCIAVDPWFIVSTAPKYARIIQTAREVNDGKPGWVLKKIRKGLGSSSKNTSISLLGLSFKANIDDLRESPALEIACRVAEEFPDHTVRVAEPNISSLPPVLEQFENVELVSATEATANSSVVALLVDHDEFYGIGDSIPDSATVIDTRGIWRK